MKRTSPIFMSLTKFINGGMICPSLHLMSPSASRLQLISFLQLERQGTYDGASVGGKDIEA